ncbi:MAG: type IV pilus assembly protein PilM [Candidatus Omnitrophica bacterium]|nr:type IV pilus assembly protein PilM [Candidatus Omnitrophota bacterium]
MLLRRKKVLGLDIGTTAIKIVVLEPTGNGFALKKIKIIDLPVVADEQLVLTLVKGALKELGGKEFALSLPGRYALIRSISIPVIAAARIDATLKIEVQHRIPFPLDQVVWSSDRLPQETDNVDFVVGAVKKDIVKKLIAPFKKFKEEAAFLDADPLVLANLVSRQSDFDRNKTYAILELGAESSNLIVFQKNLLLVRALTVAGNNFTESLKEEKGVDFPAAEKEKFSLTGPELPGSINYVLDNLVAEIQSSIDYWRFTHKGPELDQLLLTGGGANLPGLSQLIESRLRVSTRTLDPFANIDVNLGAGEEIRPELKNRLAVATGMALRIASEKVFFCALDFLPPEYIALKKARGNQIYIYLSSFLLIILSFTPGYFFNQETKLKQLVTERLNADLNEYEQYLPAVQDLEREIKDLQGRYESLNTTLNQRYLWLSRLIDVGRILPSSKIYLTKFTPSSNALVLDGESTAGNLGLAFRDVRQFILNLNALPYLQNATVLSVERDQGERLVFQITVGIK